MLRQLFLFLACTSLCYSAGSGTTRKEAVASREEIEKQVTLWHERAQGFTKAMIEDGWRLGVLQPVVYARLAQAWWKDDPVQARSWLDEGVDGALHPYKTTDAETRNKQLQAANAVFRICEYLKDEKSAEKVLDSLVEIAKQEGYDPKQHHSPVIGTLSGSIMMAGSEIAQTDPARAVKLGEILVGFHQGGRVHQLIESIRFKDPQAAMQLYSDGLTEAVNTADYNMAGELVQYAFPFFNRPGPDVSEDVKQLTVEQVGALLTQSVQSTDDEKAHYCTNAPFLANHMVSYLPPSQQGIVQASLKTCPARESDGYDADDCDSADTCLKLAETAKKTEDRARRKMLAATRAEEAKDPIRALDILHSLTSEEREWVPEWKSHYSNFGRQAVEQLYQAHDSHTMQQVIDNAPDALRAQMIIDLVEVPEVQKDNAYASTWILQARRTLEKFPAEDPMSYLEFQNRYTDLFPDDSAQVFAWTTEQLNHIEYVDFEKERKEQKAQGKERPQFGYVKPGIYVQPVLLNPKVLDDDEPYVSAAVKQLKDPETRVGFRITFLRYSLKQYERQKTKLAEAQDHGKTNTQ